MQYELNVEDVSSIRRRLHFSLSGTAVKSELDRAFSDMRRKVRLPGFRAGKVPRHLLETRFGQQVRGEVAGKLIDQSWRQAAGGFDLAGQPALEEQGELSRGEGFSFTIAVDVRPELSFDNYTGVEVAYVSVDVSDDQVENAVAARVSRKTRIEEVTDGRGVAAGDLVLTQLKLTKDDEVLADDAGTMVNTGAERYYPGVEALLEGMAVGDEKSGPVEIGESSLLEHLRGEAVMAEVKVLGIQTEVVPELDDDLAAELEFEGGADGMRAAIRMELQTAADEAGRNQARVALLEKLVQTNDFEVPAGMVDEQLQALVEELKVRRAYGGEDPRSIRFSEAEVADLRRRATFAAKASVILAGVSRQEDLGVTEEELEAKIEEIASLRGQAVEAIRGYLEREDAVGVLRDRILEEKTLEWLLERAELKVVTAEEAAAAAPVVEEAPASDVADEAVADEAVADEAVADEAVAAPAWDKSMKKAELLAVAQEAGLEAKSKMTKADLIELLETL